MFETICHECKRIIEEMHEMTHHMDTEGFTRTYCKKCKEKIMDGGK